MNYNIKFDRLGVYVTLNDKINEQLIEYVNGLIIGNDKFEEIKYQIWDCLGVNYYDIDAKRGEEIGALDRAASIWNKKMKVAIVTENKSLIDYTKEYIETIAGTSWECQIFSKVESAQKWVLEK